MLPHHQKTPTPINAIRIKPIMPKRIAQRMASLSIRKKIASRIAPAMMEIVVSVMCQLVGSVRLAGSVRWAVCSKK